MSLTNPSNAVFGNQKFRELQDVDFRSYSGKANNLIVVDGTETGLNAVNAGSIVPPFIGTGAQSDIPIFNNPLNAPPVFVDSGLAIKNVTDIFPFANGKYIDLDSNSPNTQTIGSLDILGNKSIFMGTNLFPSFVPPVDSDLLISNGSTSDKNITIANFSGTGNNNIQIIGDDVTINGTQSNRTITLDNTSLSLTDNIGNNNINMFPNSINISSVGPGNNMQIFADGNVDITSNTSNINISSFGQSTVSGSFVDITSTNGTTLNETGAGHFVQLSSVAGVTIASNSIQDLYLACDGNFRIKASSSFGTDGQVLSRVSGGSGDRCLWANPIQLKRLVYNTAGILANGSSSGIRFFNEAGGTFVISGNNSTTSVATPLFINSADYPSIGTLTPKLQIEFLMYTNAGNLNIGTFNVNLSTFTTSGTNNQMILTHTGNVGLSASITNPAITSQIRALSIPFTFPTDGFYSLTLQHAFTTNSLIGISGRVYVIYE